uniref:ZAD domain-containing protein n=1 Tax=Anopheles christyi TaxID=43041 RepID=A0A182JXM7_9DIPT
MSGTSVNLVEIVPLPVVPLPTCHARAKQLQAGLFNEIPFPTAYIANCRLCLGTKFGNGSTTIIDEQFITMMKQVFPILIVNQICLPMNVCTSCVKIVEAFYTFSSQVLANQMKLHEASTIRIPPEHDNVRVRSRDNPASNRESQEDLNQEIPIDTDLLIKLEKENDQQAPTDPLAIAADVVFDVIDEIP